MGRSAKDKGSGQSEGANRIEGRVTRGHR
jgi:hypothetical protein